MNASPEAIVATTMLTAPTPSVATHANVVLVTKVTVMRARISMNVRRRPTSATKTRCAPIPLAATRVRVHPGTQGLGLSAETLTSVTNTITRVICK